MRAAPLYLLVLTLCGCVSQRSAREQAREAYVAGQSQALAQQRLLLQAQHPSVTVQGQVESPVVPWTEDMTVTRAIVAAHYTGFMNPSAVRVLRNGQVVQQFQGVDLLRGRDAPLQSGDVVQLAP
jgi:hypothetical protein